MLAFTEPTNKKCHIRKLLVSTTRHIEFARVGFAFCIIKCNKVKDIHFVSSMDAIDYINLRDTESSASHSKLKVIFFTKLKPRGFLVHCG